MIGWGTTSEDRRSRVRFPVEYWKFLSDQVDTDTDAADVMKTIIKMSKSSGNSRESDTYATRIALIVW